MNVHVPFESPRRAAAAVLLVAAAVFLARSATAGSTATPGRSGPGQPPHACTAFVAECMNPELLLTPLPVSAPVGASAMRVARDPETGGWHLMALPTQLELGREFEIDLNQSHAGLFEVPLPHGGAMADLQGRFQSYSFARRGRGAAQFGCTESSLGLFEWLTQEPSERDRFGRPVK